MALMCNLLPCLVTVTSLGWSSPQSGRRSDTGDKISLERRQLVYSQPPRGRGEVDHGGGRHQVPPQHFVPTAPSVYSLLHQESSNSDYRETSPTTPTTITTTTPSSSSTTSSPPVRRREDMSKAGQVISIIYQAGRLENDYLMKLTGLGGLLFYVKNCLL